MSLADRQIFLRELEERLGDFVPANLTEEILRAAGETLECYELRATDTGACDQAMDLLTYFLDAKRVEGRSESTLKRYRYLLTRLQKDIGVPFQRLTVYHIRNYFTRERERGISASTIESNRSAYAEFFRWLAEEGFLRTNPMRSIGPIKQPKIQRKPYGEKELEKLWAAAIAPDSPQRRRNLAILAFLEATGCRVSELCGLDREDIDFQNRRAKVLGKGAKERTVFFGEAAELYLQEYLAERTDEDPALFLGKRHERLTPNGIRVMLQRLGDRAGVENVHPHRFRRTRATTLIDHGMVIQDVASILGHEKLDTTMRYIYMDEHNVACNYRKYA